LIWLYWLYWLYRMQADKRFQLADWRARPLTEEMLHYARSDTHYLLYCYDRLKVPLLFLGLPVVLHRAAAGSRWLNTAVESFRVRLLPMSLMLPAAACTCPTSLQAALAEMGDAVPEHLQVDLPPGAVTGEGSGALATVLERSRR